MEQLKKQGGAEFFGSFALVFAGTGVVIVNDLYAGSIIHLGVAVVFGLVIMMMIYAFGEISGAHFNPAVTIGFWAMGRMSLSPIPVYLVGQLAGGISASVLLKALLPFHSTMGATVPRYQQ